MRYLVIIQTYCCNSISQRARRLKSSYLPRLILSFCLVFGLVQLSYASRIKLIWWHSLAGPLGTSVQQLANGFNASQNEFEIKPIYKGSYLECLTSFAAAFQAGQAPNLVQIFEVGTPTMLYPKGIIKPVNDLMKSAHQSLPVSSFFSSVRQYYSQDGQLMALPFNISIPVIYFNADALEQIGYDETNFPSTWDDMERLGAKLKQKGYRCTYTSAQPAWILLESFAAIHGLRMISMDGDHAEFNDAAFVHFLNRLLRWQKRHDFEYGGRTDDATILFTSGRCPLFSQSSGSYQGLASLVNFRMGVARLPFEHHIAPYRFNNLTGGGALWAVAGQSQEQYQGIAAFLTYLTQPEVQKRWHQQTGYLPLGVTGVYREGLSNSQNPILLLAEKELSGNREQGQQQALQNQIRLINEEALDVIFSGQKSPKQALDDAVLRTNHVLARFKANNKRS